MYGAMHAGITGILVKTGKYMKNDENKIPPHLPGKSAYFHKCHAVY